MTCILLPVSQLKDEDWKFTNGLTDLKFYNSSQIGLGVDNPVQQKTDWSDFKRAKKQERN